MIPAAPSKTIKKQSRFPSANVLRGLLFSLFHSLLSHHDSQEGIISGISGCLAASCLINFRISVRRLWGHLGTSGDIWGHLGTSGTSGDIWDIWGHLGTSGDIWGHLGTGDFIPTVVGLSWSQRVRIRPSPPGRWGCVGRAARESCWNMSILTAKTWKHFEISWNILKTNCSIPTGKYQDLLLHPRLGGSQTGSAKPSWGNELLRLETIWVAGSKQAKQELWRRCR